MGSCTSSVTGLSIFSGFSFSGSMCSIGITGSCTSSATGVWTLSGYSFSGSICSIGIVGGSTSSVTGLSVFSGFSFSGSKCSTQIAGGSTISFPPISLLLILPLVFASETYSISLSLNFTSSSLLAFSGFVFFSDPMPASVGFTFPHVTGYVSFLGIKSILF